MKRDRVDVLLVEKGLADSREQAKRLIMAGLVFSGSDRVLKPGVKMDVEAALSVKGALHPFVSRGGLKLERALQVFPVDLTDSVVVDVGASTGGFTDVALRHGAALVYSVDVGYGQLAWSLRSDPRVKVMERTNFRHASPEQFMPKPSIGVMDVSFISIVKLLPALHRVLTQPATIITLVKPQFEAGPSSVGKGGIVRDPAVHEQVLHSVVQGAVNCGFQPKGLTFSPIRGGDGNIEFLLWLSLSETAENTEDLDISRIVREAHAASAD